MKTKLYKRWLRVANREFRGGARRVYEDVTNPKGSDDYPVKWRLETHKNLIGSSESAKVRMVNHILAWCLMADHARCWDDFKETYKKFSRKYWTPEARLQRTIECGRDD